MSSCGGINEGAWRRMEAGIRLRESRTRMSSGSPTFPLNQTQHRPSSRSKTTSRICDKIKFKAPHNFVSSASWPRPSDRSLAFAWTSVMSNSSLDSISPNLCQPTTSFVTPAIAIWKYVPMTEIFSNTILNQMINIALHSQKNSDHLCALWFFRTVSRNFKNASRKFDAKNNHRPIFNDFCWIFKSNEWFNEMNHKKITKTNECRQKINYLSNRSRRICRGALFSSLQWFLLNFQIKWMWFYEMNHKK